MDSNSVAYQSPSINNIDPNRLSYNLANGKPDFRTNFVELKPLKRSDTNRNEKNHKIISEILRDPEHIKHLEPHNSSNSVIVRQGSNSFQVLAYDSPAVRRKESATNICRICLMEDNEEDPVVKRCLCKGTIGPMHKSCLIRYIKSKIEIDKEVKCDLCKEKLVYVYEDVKKFDCRLLTCNLLSIFLKYSIISVIVGFILYLIYYFLNSFSFN